MRQIQVSTYFEYDHVSQPSPIYEVGIIIVPNVTEMGSELNKIMH